MTTATASPDRNTPVLGGPATYVVWTDTHACEVIKISKSGKKATLRRMKATLLNGANSGEPDALEFSPGGFCGHTSGTQRYALESDLNGEIIRVSLRTLRDGSVVWKRVGQSTASPGGRAYFGRASEFHDFNF